jgi:stage V sporulation protein AD
MAKRLGKMTVELQSTPHLISVASIAGKIEGEGPLGKYFDVLLKDDLWEEKTWEKTECKMFRESVKIALRKASLTESDVNYLVGGDLLNQIISASFAARDLTIPFLGVYTACASFAETLAVAAFLIESGAAFLNVCASSSHFDTAERQYRYPLELGTQRTSTGQRTVTGAGAIVMSHQGMGPAVKRITIGRVQDWKIKDANNMGAAMAPAAADTIDFYMKDSGDKIENFDAIVTGDLGYFGSEVLRELLQDMGYNVAQNHTDCGSIIYPKEDTFKMGGSGCGCCASVFCGYIYPKMGNQYKRILLVPTGALLSPTTTLQGETIPCIAHAIVIES